MSTDRDEGPLYLLETFPIIEREEKAAYGGAYRFCELCLAYMNALTMRNPDVEVKI